MNLRTLSVLCALAAAGQLATIGPASAAAGRPNATVTQEATSTKLAASIVSDAMHARQALLANDTATAKNDIGKAEAARTQLAGLQHGGSTIVPVYAELDDTATFSDALRGANKSPGAVPASPSPSPLTARANVATVTYLAIDLEKAKSRLDAAQQAVNDKNDQAAEDSLAAIGTDLVAVTNTVDEPLLTARQDLALARAAINANQTAAANADLKQASAALKTYGSEGHAAQARALAADIDLAQADRTNQQATLPAKIDSWWASVKDWFSTHA